MNRRLVLTGIAGVFTFPADAIADVGPAEEKNWFVQAWTDNTNRPFYMDNGKSPGRLEVTLNGKFVACALAFAIKNWDFYEISPISIGFMVRTYDLKGIKFELHDEIKYATTLLTRFTEA